MTTAPTRESLVELLLPMIRTAAAHPFSNRDALLGAMNRAHSPADPAVRAVREKLIAAAEAKVICDRGEPPVFWSRIAKPSPATMNHSIDAVMMTGAGPGHVHPNGELSLAFALEGAPAFDGLPEGWVLEAPGSFHVPTVRGGKMLIVYFLPGGAIDFGGKPA